jgi:L,D-transpeptidase YcbB
MTCRAQKLLGDAKMRGLRFDRFLAGTALALILTTTCLTTGGAQQSTSGAFDGAVPLPNQPPLPPPTSLDLSAQPLDSETRPAATSVAPEISAVADSADQAIIDKVQDLFAARVDRIFASKRERAAVEAFYQNRKGTLLWIESGAVNARARSAISHIKAAADEGLDPNDYKTPNFDALQSPEALAEAELKLTAAALTYVRHLQAGRFPVSSRFHKDIDVPQQPPEYGDALARIADAPNVVQALEEFSPPQPAYRKLKEKLAELRSRVGGGGGGQLTDGLVLKLNKVPVTDPRVPLLRERLGLGGDPADDRFDAKVAEALKKFQKNNDLPVTGTLDARTVRELNGPPRDKQIDTIVVNMERWRWYPRDLGGAAHVVVNIPEYQLRVFKDGSLVWTTRVVVGKPNLATPLLHASMKYITVNPTWNVPPSIIQNEYLPALQRDPEVLARMGLKVVNNRDGSVHIYQPPGDSNALGRVRFNFPNKFLVYQHDTPDKNLFSHEARAYSHGCMRVQDPPKYAEVLLNIARPGEGWSAERIKRMYGSAEHDIQFQRQIPVNLTYQTAYVDDEGKLQIRRDIYGIDGRMMAAVKSERGMVEMAQEKSKEQPQRTSSNNSNGNNSNATGRNRPEPRQVGFFESLFGGSNQRPTPPSRIR